MKISILVLLCCVLSATVASAQRDINKDNKEGGLYAWCIVPFDRLKRSPEQRIAMLRDLGLKSYAYDWRREHLATMAEEITLARKSKIDIVGIWLWLDADYDRPGKLSDSNQKVIEAVKESRLKTDFWLGFHDNCFRDQPDEKAVEFGVEMVRYVADRAKTINCRVALYNHGGWFGEPENQVRVINRIPNHKIGLVYNYHHGHSHIDRFDTLARTMLPYLWAVNLNGMKKGGPKIMTVGTGDHESNMTRSLRDAGYRGPFGVLGHQESKDVRVVLRRNLKGASELLNKEP